MCFQMSTKPEDIAKFSKAECAQLLREFLQGFIIPTVGDWRRFCGVVTIAKNLQKRIEALNISMPPDSADLEELLQQLER